MSHNFGQGAATNMTTRLREQKTDIVLPYRNGIERIVSGERNLGTTRH
jgi:hypothetical protein